MADYVYLDVFIEIRGRFWTFSSNFTSVVELKIASYISVMMIAQVGYPTHVHVLCIILYSTAPLVAGGCCGVHRYWLHNL